MRNTDSAESANVFPWRACTWGVLAVLTCPCHLPVLALLLSGTAAGAILSEHTVLAAIALTILFLLFLKAALRAFSRPP